MGLQTHQRQGSQQDDYGKGRYQRRKPPMAQRIVHLRPSHDQSSKGSDLRSLPAPIGLCTQVGRPPISEWIPEPKPFSTASNTFLWLFCQYMTLRQPFGAT